jgi:hypothetical protein
MTMPPNYDGSGRPARPGGFRPGPATEGSKAGPPGRGEGRAVTTPPSSSLFSSPTPPSPPASTPISLPSVPLGNYLGKDAGCPSLLTLSPSNNPEFSDAAELGSEACMRSRYRLAVAAQELTTKDSTRRCHKAIAPVLVTRKRTETGFVAGLTGGIIRCGSLWACPFCAAPERFARAAELDLNCTAMLKTSHTLGFMVLTFGDAGVGARQAMNELLGFQRKMFSTDFLTTLARFGYVGRVRSIEVTMRYDATGHPHAQYVLAFDRVLSSTEFDRLTTLLRRRWLTVTGMTDELVAVADLHAGFNLQRIGLDESGTCRTISQYMTKGGESWSLGAEMNREDVKRSRGDTFAPFDVLREFIDTGDTQLRDVWTEYEEATFNVAQTAYTRGFKAYLEVIRAKADAAGVSVPLKPAPSASVAKVPEIDTAADEADEEDVYDAGDGHKGFVLVMTATWNFMHRRRLLAEFLIEVGRLTAGEDPVTHFEIWLAEQGAPIPIAMGFDEPMSFEAMAA